MKNTLKLSLIVLLTIFTINTSFAGGGSVNQIDYNYNGSLNNSSVGTKLKIKGYINPSSLQFGDDGLYGLNMKYGEYFLESRGMYNIIDGMSFGLFYPQSDFETIEIKRDDGSSYYSRYFDDDYNKGLMLFASKNLIDSINYYDPTYYELGNKKIYNNGVSINRNYFENGKFINTYGNNIKGGTDIKGNIVASAGGNSQNKEGNVVIEGEIKEINIDEEIFMCDVFYKSFNGEYKSYGEKGRCLNLVNDIKRDFYTSKIDSETFEELFKKTWESYTTQNLKINTKVFVMDKITVNGITYGQKASIYNLSLKYKKSLEKTLEKINKLSDEKKEELQYRIDSLIETQQYGRKNYMLLDYLKKGMETYYPESKKHEASIILGDIREEFDGSESLMNFLNSLIGDE